MDGNIGIIGGTGWLGGGIARSLLATGTASPSQLWLSNRSGNRAGFEIWKEVKVTQDNRILAGQCDTLMLSVPPDDFRALSIRAEHHLVVSVMAGISVSTIAEATGAARIVRALPNAAAEIGMSYTPWFAAPAVTEDDKAQVRALFQACGRADEVPNQDQIDYFTGLTGAGSAFPALFAQTMLEDAVRRGVEPAVAERAIRQLFLGAGHMIAQSERSPAEQVQAFIDYDGTTAAGLRAIIESSFAQHVTVGLQAAYAKAKEFSVQGPPGRR